MTLASIACNHPNADPVAAAITGSGRCSWVELREKIGLEEALDIWESISVERINEAYAAKHAKKK